LKTGEKKVFREASLLYLGYPEQSCHGYYYTQERHKWLDELTMDDIVADIKTYQNNQILE